MTRSGVAYELPTWAADHGYDRAAFKRAAEALRAEAKVRRAGSHGQWALGKFAESERLDESAEVLNLAAEWLEAQ